MDAPASWSRKIYAKKFIKMKYALPLSNYFLEHGEETHYLCANQEILKFSEQTVLPLCIQLWELLCNTKEEENENLSYYIFSEQSTYCSLISLLTCEKQQLVFLQNNQWPIPFSVGYKLIRALNHGRTRVGHRKSGQKRHAVVFDARGWNYSIRPDARNSVGSQPGVIPPSHQAFQPVLEIFLDPVGHVHRLRGLLYPPVAQFVGRLPLVQRQRHRRPPPCFQIAGPGDPQPHSSHGRTKGSNAPMVPSALTTQMCWWGISLNSSAFFTAWRPTLLSHPPSAFVFSRTTPPDGVPPPLSSIHSQLARSFSCSTHLFCKGSKQIACVAWINYEKILIHITQYREKDLNVRFRSLPAPTPWTRWNSL